MFLAGSRYGQARPFDPPPARYSELIRPREVETLAGVVEHTLRSGDRLDLLAHHFYADGRQWWRILDANPQLLCGSDLEAEGMEGHVLVIPRGSD